jgi:hypothetical protein
MIHAERCAYHFGGDCTCGAIGWPEDAQPHGAAQTTQHAQRTGAGAGGRDAGNDQAVSSHSKGMEEINMAKPQLHQFAFGPNDFVNAVDTGLPGLWAVVCNGIVMVARRGGVWYEPRGNEAHAAADALSLSLDGKYVCVDGHAVEDICEQCEKNIRDCQCQEEEEANEAG